MMLLAAVGAAVGTLCGAAPLCTFFATCIVLLTPAGLVALAAR